MGCRVQGSGLWWQLRRKYIWGDARMSAGGRSKTSREEYMASDSSVPQQSKIFPAMFLLSLR